MIKSKALATALALGLATGAFAQSLVDLTPLQADMVTLFTSVGRDVSPRLHQLAISGNDFIGAARLDGKRGLTVTLPGASIATMDGLGRVLGSTSSDAWTFSLISIPNLVSSKVPSTYYNMLTSGPFALPAFRLGVGLALPMGFEAFVNGLYISSGMTSAAVGAFGSSLPIDLNKLGADVGMLSVGTQVRKVILSDRSGYFTPSVSLGLSYAYSSFDLAINKFNFASLGMQPPDLQGLGTLGLDGTLGFHTRVNTVGALFAVSKNVLWVLTPFMKMGAYYHITDYSSSFDVLATVTPTAGGVVQISQRLNAPVSIQSGDASVVMSGGLEVKIVVVVLTLAASLDLESSSAQEPNLPSLTTGSKFNGLGLSAALRLQF